MATEDAPDLTAIMTIADGAAGEAAPGELPGRVLDGLPHGKEIGLRLISAEDGVARMMVPFDPRLIGDPATGVLHGGVVTTLLDTCSGASVLSVKGRPASTATLDLRVDYMRSAAPGAAVFAEAECYRIARSVAFVRAVAFDADKDDPIATATGAFMFERAGGEGA
jgi:uncharacterized protein (TIGR00369 family)